MSESQLASNRKALFDYEILETFEAGLSLLGSEVKSLRQHGGSLRDSYIMVSISGVALLKNASIAPYNQSSVFNHEERRDRPLLLHKKELHRLTKALQDKGVTAVALALYLNSRGWIKVKVAVVRGKRSFDKRRSIKEKEAERSIQSAMKNRV